MERFALSEIQAKAILEMQLQRLTGLERQKIIDELVEVQKTITRLKEILASEKVLMEVIAGELAEVRQLFGDERRTEIQGEAADLDTEDLIAEEEMVVTVSHLGYVKRNPVSLYRAQKRGGRGKTGAATREEDFLERLFVASTHSYVLVFSNQGKVYWLKVHEIPQAGRAARGKPIVNLVQMAQGEKVAAILPVRRLPDPPGGGDEAEPTEEVEEKGSGEHVFMATRRGLIKKTRLDAFSRPRGAGIIALGIEEGDELIQATLTSAGDHLLLSTAQGMAIRFEETDARAMGRTAYGVKGINLDDGDEVVAAEVLPLQQEGAPVPTILTLTRNGYGKRTELSEYRVQSRGGKGLITIKTTERNGPVVAAARVLDTEEVMLITNHGMLIRMVSSGISVIGRNTQGVRLITLESQEEQVVGVARVAETSPEAEAAGVEEPGGELAAPVETAPDQGEGEEEPG
jgi:DNA gyrase subunit A